MLNLFYFFIASVPVPPLFYHIIQKIAHKTRKKGVNLNSSKKTALATFLKKKLIVVEHDGLLLLISAATLETPS